MSKLIFFFVVSIFSSHAFSRKASVCEQGLRAFSDSLHPVLVQKCSRCHGDGGFAAPHAVSDPRAAYGVAKRLTNFTNMESSRFYQKVRSAHWVEYSSTARGMTLDELEKGLNDWWDAGESGCPTPFMFQTEAQIIPSTIPHRDGGNFQKLTWDLGASSNRFKGCSFSIEIQVFSKEEGSIPRSYRVRNPVQRCAQGTQKVSGLRVLVGDSTQSYENIYDDIDEEIRHDGRDKVLSTELMIIIPAVQKNSISIGYRELKWVERIEL